LTQFTLKHVILLGLYFMVTKMREASQNM